ncbi:MAG: hypothetical protein AAF804_15540, partial [Bacteroidota bacterium]
MAESTPSITKSEIRLTEEGYQLFLNGEPFYIKGAGVDKGSPEALAMHGANALRTWSTDNGKAVLDQAHELGLKVMMGIWVGLEPGVEPSADLYSLSRMFYEMLMDVLPAGHWQAPSGGRTDVPSDIDELIRKGLSDSPRSRQQSVAEYRTALEEAMRSAQS